jgi:hypothetical protein
MTKTLAFHAIRNQGVMYAVHADGRTVGTVKLDRAIFSGWIAYRPGSETAILGADGYAAEFDTRDDAARALTA